MNDKLVRVSGKVVVTFYLRLRNEFEAFPTKNQASNPLTQGQPIRGLVFDGKWLEFISQSQIKGDYNNFSIFSLTHIKCVK